MHVFCMSYRHRRSKNKKAQRKKKKIALKIWNGTGPPVIHFSPSLSFPLSPSPSITFLFTFSYGLHIVSRQHALLTSTLHSSIHPSFINWLNIYYHIPVEKRHFILVSCSVVIHCPVTFLKTAKDRHIRHNSKKSRDTEIIQ